MEVKEARAALEALLFASGTPISAEKLAQALKLDKETVCKVAQNLADELDARQSGLCVVRLGEEYQLCSRTEHAQVIRHLPSRLFIQPHEGRVDDEGLFHCQIHRHI